jgi:prepilin-type N-terminal cleavage/methylation domain-containing protein
MARIHTQGGFTIVELLVTMIIGGLLTGAVTVLLTTHSAISQRGRDLILANSYVEKKVEGLRSIGFLGLSDGSTDITSELPSELKSPRSGSMQITAETADIKRVYVSLTYSDQGTPRTYTYTTFIGELGVGQY